MSCQELSGALRIFQERPSHSQELSEAVRKSRELAEALRTSLELSGQRTNTLYLLTHKGKIRTATAVARVALS